MRSIYKLITIFSASIILIFICLHFQIKAQGIPDLSLSINHTLQDVWHDEIFSSRTFSNPVVCIQADEYDLYSEENGILNTQYALHGMEGERQIKLFVYDKDGNPLIAQNAGIRISGATSRNAIRKSFRIIARKQYDKRFPKFTCDLWEGRHTLDGSDKYIGECSSFVLHSVRKAMDSTGIHNSVGYSLARKAGFLDASPTTPAALYINGIYQGAYFIMPAKTDNALSELYNIARKEDIELVSVFDEEKVGYQEHPELLQEFKNFAAYVQTSDVNDPAVAAEIERQLDVRQCLQYYAVNLLLANGDWMDNNLRVWRCKNNGLPYQDGKWRFFLFDLDWIGSFPDMALSNFQIVTQSNDNYNLLSSLLKNPQWLSMFKDIIAQMEQDAFNETTIETVFEEEDARMIDEITYDFHSDAFEGYLRYSVNSAPLTAEDYLSLDDRQWMIEDFKAHMLKTPGIINECLETYYP